MHVYITFFQCSSSESSLSHLFLNWPLKWGSLGQDRSCQHLGALGKDANMGCRGQRMSMPQHSAAGKKYDFTGCKCLGTFISLQKYRGNDYWIIHTLFNNPFQKNQGFFWKHTVKESEKDHCKQDLKCIKNRRNWHTCKYNEVSTIHAFGDFFHSTWYKEQHDSSASHFKHQGILIKPVPTFITEFDLDHP